MAAKLYLKDIIDNNRTALSSMFFLFSTIFQCCLQKATVGGSLVVGDFNARIGQDSYTLLPMVIGPVVLTTLYERQWGTSGEPMPRTQAPPGSNKISTA